MIRILIADDHAIVRQGLKQIVADSPDMVVAGEAEDGWETLNMALNNEYDVVLLDLSMPNRSGLEVLKELKSQKPEIKILVLSMYSEEQYAVRVLKAGAAGYLTKKSAPEELVKAVRQVSLGRKFVSSSLAEKLAYELETGAKKELHHALSDREYQVMRMIASGKNTKEIASELLLSVKTINTYRSRTLEKLKLRNNVELTLYAIQNKLID